MGVVALGLIFPAVGDILERPFVRLARAPSRPMEGLMLGLSPGLLSMPHTGPVPAAVTVVGANNHRIGPSAVTLMVAFALGVAVPLLAFGMAGQRLVGRMRIVRTRTGLVRKGFGVVIRPMRSIRCSGEPERSRCRSTGPSPNRWPSRERRSSIS